MMQQNIKPSMLWTIVGVVIVFFMLNHWMSGEISKPTSAQKAVESPADESPKAQTQTLTIPQLPEPETVAAQIPQAPTPKKTQQEEDFGPSEPIYEPPDNSVILVQ